ncbi:hypothetical protein H0H92_009019 [Tricholoma furcatifolium]|nr:hypothetical protein H0H92_009019 [Tricholoma furcatifolium]
MDGSPALVLVSPTPLKFDTTPPTSTPSTSYSPPPRFSTAQTRVRPTSETTIVSIYSMYGDDHPRTSWSTSSVVAHSDRKSHDTTAVPPVPTVKIKLADNQRLSTHNDTELAFHDNHDTTNDTYTPTDSAKEAKETLSLRTSATSSRLSRISPRNSHVKSEYIDQDLAHLPPLPPSRHDTPAPTPPRQPSPTPNHLVSPPSKVSLVPSEGEDMDAFHVRNTYAQLEVSGVKGDGFDEGVERTRARIGPSRSSQLNAIAAVGDGTEKSKSLGAKEMQTLASVDRYGFFSVPSHDRLVLLNSAPLLKRLAPVKAGQPTAPASPTALRGLPPVTTPPKESSRIAKWTRMLVPLTRDTGANIATWGVRTGKDAKLRRRVYKGIPDPWRRAAWDLLMSRYSSLGPREIEALAREYREALDKPSSYDIQIDLDVPRTISGHIMFRTRYGAGQRSLFHVLHCFSLRCGKCGYVQGMGPIAATLLCYFEPELVYASLVRLHNAYSLHTVFSPGFPGLLEAIYVQERITEQMMPDVFKAFKKHMISTTSYATKWYITLFSNSVPFQTQLRFWDAFLMEGYDVFIAISVAIVWIYRDQITSASANFETVLSLLSSFFVPEDEDVLMAWIGRMLGDSKLRASMRAWKEEWRALVASGKEGNALL